MAGNENTDGLSSAASLIAATERTALAVDFLKAAQWKLVFSRGTGKGEEGMKMRVRIFATGCPRNALKEVQNLLAEESPVVNPRLDGHALAGTFYHRTSWWTGPVGAPMNPQQGQVTIVRELTDDINLSHSNTVEDDCGNTTSIRFVWDATSVEDITLDPNSGAQGFQVKLGGVSRDPDTGYYSYYVTTTERKYLHLPEHVTAEDAFSKSYAEAWLGMRGTIAAPLDDNGLAVAVIDPDAFVAGTQKSVSWRRNNDDCTLDAEGRKQVAKPDIQTRVACDKDLYKEVDTTDTSAQATALAHAPEPVAGLKVGHLSTLRQDGKFDNRVQNDQERKVEQSTVVTAATVFETRATRTDSNTPVSAVPVLPAAGRGLTATLQVEKTPGDLRTSRLDQRQELQVDNLRVVKENTLLKQETVSERVNAAPLGDPVAPGGGIITGHSDVLTDGGFYRSMKTVRRAVQMIERVKSAVILALSQTTSVTSSNMAGPISTVLPAVIGVRREIQNQKNEDGTNEQVLSETTSTPATTGTLKTSSDQFRDRETERKYNRREIFQASAGGTLGQTFEAQVSLQADGTYEGAVSKGQEKPVPLSRYDEDMTKFGMRITERNEHQNLALPAPDAIGKSSGYEKTPGGLLNTMRVRWDLASIPDAGRVLSKEKGGDVRHNYETVQTFFKTEPEYGKTGLVLADGNTIYTSRIEIHDSGGYVKTYTVDTPIKNISESISKVYIYTEDDFNGTGEEATITLDFYVLTFANSEWSLLAAEAAAFVNPSSLNLRWSMNKYWLYDGGLQFEYTTVTTGT